ncbi:fumarylacetoacetate hydrolase family protein [Pseudotabrizicola formosa]|uniref:fumarylacetoacetate hydrolase family protein n=1 Tax=Pseudotabrizicola formosa TaxID=2030009 RepID=UPI000CD29E49|nr:fumarylacetoacetate hydrolase family protein [Pseudotabrizicola formosa]
MKLVTYRTGVEAAARLGVISEDLVLDVADLGAAFGEAMPDTMLGLIDSGRAGLAALSALLARAGSVPPIGTATALTNVTLLAPIPRPRKNVFGIGLNYLDHVAESAAALDTDAALPKQPVIFSKPPTSVIGPDGPIHHNKKITQQLDWEVELGVIIGSTARRVAREAALAHVFGYTVLIDISARDCRRAGQWIYSKGQDTFCPMGPCIVTADEIPDPQVLDLWLTLNGEEKQRSNTSHMLFKVDELIADISQGITLEPGDIIASGTPAGVGAGRSPQEWMWPGDRLVACVEGIGTLRHAIIDATPE